MPNPKGNEQTLKKFKPKWKSGKTQTIRVPVALADSILDYAHRLDEGVIASDTVAQPCSHLDYDSLTQVICFLEEVRTTPRNNFSKAKRKLVQESIDKLNSLLQVNRNL